MVLSDSISIPDTVFAQEVDDEIVILDTVSEEYFGLDEMAAVIWHYLDESNGSLQAVYDTMYAMYDVDAKQLEDDICHFVQELVNANLVQLQM